MIRQDVNRRNPVKDTIITLLFPGFHLWKQNEKIQGLSISVATYIGYFIGIGFLILFFMLYYNWKKTIEHNQKYGFQSIEEEEYRWIWLSGLIGGITGHPLFLLVTYQWALEFELVKIYSDSLIQVNAISFLIFLTIIFGLRFLLFYSLRQTIGKKKSVEIEDEFKVFTSNNASLIISTPLLPILLVPLPPIVLDQIIAFLLIPLTLIFGTRILYNNITTIRSKM